MQGVFVYVMAKLIKSNIDEINKLHGELTGMGRTTVELAIRCGELLCAEKERVGHGKWESWAKENLAFSLVTAGRYMRCYNNQDRFKSVIVKDLKDAYALIYTPVKERKSIEKPQDPIDVPEIFKRVVDEPNSAAEDTLPAALPEWQPRRKVIVAPEIKGLKERIVSKVREYCIGEATSHIVNRAEMADRIAGIIRKTE